VAWTQALGSAATATAATAVVQKLLVVQPPAKTAGAAPGS
jgi:hypothetical protein